MVVAVVVIGCAVLAGTGVFRSSQPGRGARETGRSLAGDVSFTETASAPRRAAPTRTSPPVAGRAEESIAQQPAAAPAAPPAQDTSSEPPFETLVGDVEREVRDARWRSTAETGILERARAAQLPPETALEAVYCASTRCVLRVAGPTRAAVESVQNQLPMIAGLRRGRLSLRQNERGGYSIELVAARQGFDVRGRPVVEEATASAD